MRGRRLALAAGLLLVAAGTATLLVPSFGRSVSALVVRVALLGVGGAALVLAARLVRGGRGTATVDVTPECRPEYRRPAGALAERLEAVDWAAVARGDDGGRAALVEDLRDLAVAVLVRTDVDDRAAADRLLDSGEWTDDPHAAALFERGTESVGIRDTLRAVVTREPPTAHRIRHATAALAGRLDGEVGPLDIAARPPEGTEVTSRGEYWPDRPPEVGSADRRRVAGAAALLAGGFGVLGGRPALLLAGAVGFVLAVGNRLLPEPEPTVDVSRRLSSADPAPGETVTVDLNVENTGDATLFDLRVVDAVPAGLTVVDGTARLATPLRPGRTATLTYDVRTVPGRHRFGRPLVTVRGAVGGEAAAQLVETDGAAVTCGFGRGRSTPGATAPTSVLPGRATSGAGGAGTEFHSVREYRHGDPLGAVDWRRLARTGELTTVQYHEERRTAVVLVLDAREAAYVAPPGSDVPAVQRCVRAAHELATGLSEAATPVGLLALSPEDCWLPPRRGGDRAARLRATLLRDPAFAWVAPNGETDLRSLDRVPGTAHAVFLSPMTDPGSLAAGRRLATTAAGATVLSPRTDSPTRSHEGYAHASRWRRLRRLRRAGARVVDWPWGRPAEEGWPGG